MSVSHESEQGKDSAGLCAQAQVQDDIASSVLRNPLRLCSSFNRPNISYHVRYQLNGSSSPVNQIADLIEEMKDSTGATPCSIIYTLKRETADEVAGRLKAKGNTPHCVDQCGTIIPFLLSTV